jgi:superkiller protein 3
VAIVAALSVLTWRQIGYWSDQEVLFRHTVAVTEGNGRANLILSQALGEKGRYREALGYAEEAARLEPMYPPAHGNLGFLLYRAGRIDEAIDRFRRAILLQPDYAEAHYNLGIAYGKQGRVEEAMKEMALGAELRSRQSLR